MVVDGSLTEALGEFTGHYDELTRHLCNTQRDVTAGAVAIDGGLLTDHGPEHVRTVINRASQLVRTNRCDLSHYEVYLLLAAIQLHDVGNIKGRKMHQITASEVAEWLGPSIGRDAIQRRTIVQVAAAHTAGDSEKKDTIGKLANERFILNKRVRPRLLAAILRFADELADDRARSSRFLHETDNVPTSSEVFHAYAYALHSVVVNHESREVELHFEMDSDRSMRELGKGDTQVYLLDEIFDRSVKLHLERTYAMSFMRDWISIDAIRVFVEVYGDGLDPKEKIGYRLADRGYPEEPAEGIYSLAPELSSFRDWGGLKVTGSALASRIGEN